MTSDPIYLDYAATTPVRGEVQEAMAPYLGQVFGNPSSGHRWGREAQAALEEARARIASCLGATRREIVFVRGGTESDNLAVLGRAEAVRSAGVTPHVVTTVIEHKAVLDAARSVESLGGRCTLLPVDRGGAVDVEALAAALARAEESRSAAGEARVPSPCLVSVMWVNNEVGTLQPVEEIARRCAEAGVSFHTDAVQAVGKVPVRVDEVPVSLLSLTGHKIYGPKSTGVLFMRDGVEIGPRLHGGSQESGLRPGTQDVAGAVGMARALELMVGEQETFARSRRRLRDELEARLTDGIRGLVVHGASGERAPHILNVGVPGVSPELLQISLDLEGLAVSGGSACQSGTGGGSHVVRGLEGDAALPAAIRFSLGRDTTEAEVERAAAITLNVVERLQSQAAAAAGAS